MVSWSSIQSLIFLIGPLVLPKAIAYYRSIVKNNNNTKKRGPPPYISLLLLLLSTLLSLLSTLPLFCPPNIFLLTSSRLHTSTNVLYTRLSALRPLTPQDDRLRDIFSHGALEARLLYARYGPQVLLLNPMSVPGDVDAARDAMGLALLGLLELHVLHLVALGVVTSRGVYGYGYGGSGSGAAAAARWWRNLAVMMGLGLCVVEMYMVVMYDDTANQRSVRVSDVDFLYWKLRVYRGVAMAVVDGLLAVGMWLEATGRVSLMNVVSSPSERVLDLAQRLEGVLVKARGLGVIRNGSVRDASMRRLVDDYWFKENEVMKDVMEQPEVLEAQRNALRRVDPLAAARDAERFLEYVLGMPSSSSSSSSAQAAATS